MACAYALSLVKKSTSIFMRCNVYHALQGMCRKKRDWPHESVPSEPLILIGLIFRAVSKKLRDGGNVMTDVLVLLGNVNTSSVPSYSI